MPAYRKKRAEVEVFEGSGNIFADLGLPDPETHLLKSPIVTELHRLTEAQGLDLAQAAQLMGLSELEATRLFKGAFRQYSVERLRGFLAAFESSAPGG